MKNSVDETKLNLLDFTKLDRLSDLKLSVLPVVVQNAVDQVVIMIGYVNEKALKESIQTGKAVFWSTSRNELWRKGQTSGDVLKLVEVRVNCEQNSLLFKVIPQGTGSCHTKREDGKTRSSCFYRILNSDNALTIDPEV